MIRPGSTPMRITAALLLAAGLRAASTSGGIADAARKGDTNIVRTLVARHANVDEPEADGTTALHWAAENDDPSMVGVLIRAGARVGSVNRYGVTPLAIAARNGNAAVVELLLNAGADSNAALPEGETALMTAARAGNADVVRALLGHDAKVNVSEEWHGETALMWAAAANHVEVLKALIEHGADVRVHARSAGFTPSNEGYLPNSFLPAGNFSALMFAVREGHVECVRLLIAAGSDINDKLPSGATALHIAIMNAHYEVAELLLQKGADANAAGPGWTPLHELVWSRNPNRHFNLPPALATGSIDSLEFARILLSRGSDPNARVTREPGNGFRNWMNRIGATPFILAAKAADPALMRLLVANGADATLVSKDHTTALMAAAGIGFWPAESPGTEAESLEAVRLALELGGDVNAANDGGYTAMHGAAVHGSNSVVTFLAEKGAQLDPVTIKEGWTPVAIADGVFIANTWKATPHTAALLRRIAIK